MVTPFGANARRAAPLIITGRRATILAKRQRAEGMSADAQKMHYAATYDIYALIRQRWLPRGRQQHATARRGAIAALRAMLSSPRAVYRWRRARAARRGRRHETPRRYAAPPRNSSEPPPEKMMLAMAITSTAAEARR